MASVFVNVLWSDVKFFLSPEIKIIFLQAWKKVRLVQERVGKSTLCTLNIVLPILVTNVNLSSKIAI